jgi:hypothetical protein
MLGDVIAHARALKRLRPGYPRMRTRTMLECPAPRT